MTSFDPPTGPSVPSTRLTAESSPASADDTPVAGIDVQTTDESSSAWRSRPMVVLVAITAALVGASVVVAVRDGDSTPAPKPDIPLDAWAPYWALDDALVDFDRRVDSMRAVSPFWYNAVGVERIEIDPNAADDRLEEFLEIARDSSVSVVPSIVDAMPAGGMAAILADPDDRERHVETLREFAREVDADGLDIDYEQFAFADGRETWETTRPAWVAFITELGAALHADGLTLTVSIPPVYDAERTGESGFWVYDYGAIAPHVDWIRIMAYDFSVDEPGPIAPLSFVERAIVGALEATDAPEKLVLGLPAYGRNWPTGTLGDCPASELQGRTGVTARSVDDLIVRRAATPVRDAVAGEWFFDYELEVRNGETSCIQGRRVHYVDGDGVRERMALARRYQLDGVALWALGFEDDAVWNAILPTVQQP